MAAATVLGESHGTTKVVVQRDGTMISPDVELPPQGLYTSEGHPPDDECDVKGGFEGMQEKHIKAYCDHGFVIIRNAFDASIVKDALDAIDRICREEDEEFKSACRDLDVAKAQDGYDVPGIQFEAAANGLPEGQRADFVRKLKNFHKCNKTLGDISYDARMLNAVSQLIYGWGSACPGDVDIFQALALLKPPRIGREKPWHQDNAYFNVTPGKSPSGAPTAIVGIWIALDEATPENGCMYIIPKQHQKPIPHWQKRDWQICDDSIPSKTLAVPMRSGDLLFFSSLLPHGTPPNLSDNRRRAIQFHMIPKDYPDRKSVV